MTNTTATVRAAYDVWVDQYDSNINKTRDLNAQVLRAQLTRLRRDQRVLELGCGTGLNTIWLAERTHSVVGVDISEKMLGKARARLSGHKASFLVADITQPWPISGMFDYIVANLVLEHIEFLTPVFAAAFKHIRPGGTLYLAELHPFRQLKGSQAKYIDPQTGAEVLVTAFLHHISEYINETVTAGFSLSHVGEWQHANDSELRLLTLTFQRPLI